MISTRRTSFELAALLLIFTVAWPLPSQALGNELTGEHLEPLLPETVDGYTRENVDAEDDEANVQAVYQSEAEERPITLTLAYGADAATLYRQLRAHIVRAEAETDDLTVQDRTFAVAQARSNLHALRYSDHFLIVASYRNLDADVDPAELHSTIAAFFESFDLNRLAEWEPPEGVEYEVDENVPTGTGNVANCYDMECFEEHVSHCEEAQMIGALGRRVTVMYTVEEPVEPNQCRLSFVFTDNPNPDFEDTPLYFTIALEDGFAEEDLKNVMEDCFEGEGESYNCEGPLLDLMEDK